MLSSIYSLCLLPVHFLKKLGLKYVDHMLQMWLSSSRYEFFWDYTFLNFVIPFLHYFCSIIEMRVFFFWVKDVLIVCDLLKAIIIVPVFMYLPWGVSILSQPPVHMLDGPNLFR